MRAPRALILTMRAHPPGRLPPRRLKVLREPKRLHAHPADDLPARRRQLVEVSAAQRGVRRRRLPCADVAIIRRLGMRKRAAVVLHPGLRL
eukprot:CAMPEP_0174901762 /NCGR_PEP_ID=MMETSP0167-20121228/35625_1 /TAXON_ID=38298 /ORGANISM="Rhodella maculata, Strain CCMP736" /LENGTH=90 /DNA_ID=CAMNT_0016143539 /DNA_START=255 /DNA_END=523 /DNA_ORIENTATION=-